jgi:raffinose/stachyose/melibiose transport system permease protein
MEVKVMKAKITVSKIVKNLIAWIVSLIMIIPLFLMVINSLKTETQADTMGLDFPQNMQFHFENYVNVVQQGHLLNAFLNSMLYACSAIAISIIFSSMAAYVLARNRTKLNNFIYFFLILGLAMPASYISLMKIMQITHLINTALGIILLYVSIEIPVSVFILYGFIASVPKEMDEAGIIDGCGAFKLFFSVVLPLLKPAIVTVVILTFLDSWNQFVFPLYFLNSSTMWPMTLSVYNFFGQFAQSWNLVSADVILTSLPVIIIYLLGQKYIISGMTVGAVKG